MRAAARAEALRQLAELRLKALTAAERKPKLLLSIDMHAPKVAVPATDDMAIGYAAGGAAGDAPGRAGAASGIGASGSAFNSGPGAAGRAAGGGTGTAASRGSGRAASCLVLDLGRFTLHSDPTLAGSLPAEEAAVYECFALRLDDVSAYLVQVRFRHIQPTVRSHQRVVWIGPRFCLRYYSPRRTVSIGETDTLPKTTEIVAWFP